MDYRFRFTLTHGSASPTVSLQIDEPIGWKDIKLKLDRHDKFFSLIELFEVPLIFYGNNGEKNGGRDFLMDIINNYGFDETVEILIEISEDDGDTYEELFSGLISLNMYQVVDSTKIECPIRRNDFWSKFTNRMETAVNLQSTEDLDGNTVEVPSQITINLSPQQIEQKFRGNYATGDLVPDPGSDFNGYYFPFDAQDIELNEVPNKYTLTVFGNTVRPGWIFDAEYAGAYVFDIRIEISRVIIIPATPPLVTIDNMQNGADYYVRWYFQKNEETPIEFTISDHTRPAADSTAYEYYTALDLVKGDRIYIYGYFGAALPGLASMLIWGTDNSAVGFNVGSEVSFGAPPSGSTNPSFLYITGNTIFPETSCESFFLHDAAAAIIKRIISEGGQFYSEFFGSSVTNERQYLADGCGWNYAIQKGLHLRGYGLDDKKFFLSFMDWWEGVNPIFNLSLSYDLVDGEPVIKVEQKSAVLDPTPVVYLDYVNGIEEKLDQNHIFKKITIGYSKWQSEEIRGLDDPQTRKTYATRMQYSGREYTVESSFIAASTAIENTRRKTIAKSSDYKLDNDTFIIALNPEAVSSSPESYVPELDENFTSTTNLQNPESRYNLFLTPFRNFCRWMNFFHGSLYTYQDSAYRFTSGEGNYTFSSAYDCNNGIKKDCADTICGDIAENDNLTVSQFIDDTDYLFRPVVLEFEHPLSWSQYKTIRDNRHKAIGVSTTAENHEICFIKTLDFTINKGTAKFVVWKK